MPKTLNFFSTLFVFLSLVAFPTPILAGVLGTFHSTQGGTTDVTISNFGSVIGYSSPAGYEHINVGGIATEGYALCYDDVNAYAVNSDASGQFETVFAGCTPAKCIVVRGTLDTKFLLTQEIEFKPSVPVLRITMTLENQSGGSISGVHLSRISDMNVDSDGANGWAGKQNNFAVTSEAGIAWNDPSSLPAPTSKAHGLVLRHMLGILPQPKIFDQTNGFSCSPTALPTPVTPGAGIAGGTDGPDDYAVVLDYDLGTINAGAKKIVVMEYHRAE